MPDFKPRRHLHDFADLQEAVGTTRTLAAGGFVLADPFDTVLRELSEEYLRAAWRRVAAALDRYHLDPDDLSWGWVHPGHTYAPGFPPSAPSDFTGWTSRQLAQFYEDSRHGDVDAELRAGRPALGCVDSYRTRKWRIPPADAPLGLQLIEALWVDEITDWAREWVLREGPYNTATPHGEGPWIDVGRAIRDGNQERLDAALDNAQRQYSQAGYRIMLRGFAAFVNRSGFSFAVHLSEPIT